MLLYSPLVQISHTVDESATGRASGGSTRGGIRTLADVADDAAGDRVCGDPDALLEPFLPRRAPRVLDGDEGLGKEHLQGVAGRVGPQEAANRQASSTDRRRGAERGAKRKGETYVRHP